MPHSIKGRRRAERFFRIFLILLCICLMWPMKAKASWIDRDHSGIYGGSVNGGFEEDDGDVQDAVRDDATNWFVQKLEQGLSYIIMQLGTLLYSILEQIGASLDQLIYGRLVRDPPLFTFDLGEGNVWGIVSSAVYQILRNITILGSIMVFVARIAFASYKSGTVVRTSLVQAFSGIIFGMALLILMPYFLDVALYLRDCILYLLGTDAAHSLFGTSGQSASIITTLAAAAENSILSALMYDAAVVLNGYFVLGYVGVALSMCINFVLFPFVVLRMYFDKQILQNWVWEQISCMLVPVMDAVLIMIPAYMGLYGSSVGLLDSVSVAVVQLAACYCILPARAMMRSVLGLHSNPLEGTGLRVSAMLGARMWSGVKDAVKENAQDKKNAEASKQNAEMEDDLAALDKDQDGEGEKPKMQSADEMMDQKKKPQELGDKTDTDSDYEDGSPLGQEQTYASGKKASLDAKEKELEQLAKAQDNARRLDEIDLEMEDAKNALDAYERENEELKADPNLSDQERLALLGGNQAQEEQLRQQISALEAEKEEILGTNNVDKDLAAARQRRKKLEAEYELIENDASLDADAKQQALHAINGEIETIDETINGLDAQKQLQKVQREKATLAMEPEMLHKEQKGLEAKGSQLLEGREQLLREKSQLLEQQGEYSPDDPRGKAFKEQVEEIDRKLLQNAQELGQTEARKGEISKALLQQENELRDRQAYNLHERIKAQEAYEDAKQNLEGAEQKAAMDKAQMRLSDLAEDDRRISAKLKEISPDLNTYSRDDLLRAKRGQQVKRAQIQRDIAKLEEKLANDPDNVGYYKPKIARLRSEAAEANLQSAKLDQMLDSFQESGSRRGGQSASSGQKLDEYGQRRRAILERYANVENFDSPEFRDISHEKKAQLYRERAAQITFLRRSKMVGRTAGALTGALMGTWLGDTGVFMGSMVGDTIGEAVSQRVAVHHNLVAAQKNGSLPADYGDIPNEFKVSADLRDNRLIGQQRTVEQVQMRLEESINNEQFIGLFKERVTARNIVESEIRQVFQTHGITKENYAERREELQMALNRSILQRTRALELDIVEQCAGNEFASLSPSVKERIRERVMRSEAETEHFLELFPKLHEKWQPDYEDYLS